MISLTALLLFVISVLCGFYIRNKYNLSYWRRKNIAFIEPNIVFGNLLNMLKMSKNTAQNLQDLYNHENAKDQPILGIYILNKPVLLIREPEVIKSILVKNFNKFSNRYGNAGKKDVLGSLSLFFTKNPLWKELRSRFTPVFSSGKVKQMFPLIQDIGNELEKRLDSFEADKDQSFIVEVKEITALYTTDVIASVGFGIQANSLRNPQAEFRQNAWTVFEFDLFRALHFTVVFFIPHLAKFSRCKVFPDRVEKFFRNAISFVINQRIENGSTRNDLVGVLAAFKRTADEERGNNVSVMSDDVLISQALFFFVAGYDTSASTMSFCLYELAKNPAIQTRLREEIRGVLLEGPLTYEGANEMEYLNMVVLEVLRMYPPLPFLDRECTMPNGEEEFSLKPECDFAVPNNMGIFIPIFGIHRDPKYFPNPDQFDPERFSPENKKNIQPYTYMPFGLGPRNCIGELIGTLQAKIGIINILKNHYVTVCDKSHDEMKFYSKAVVLQANGGIFCKFIRDPLV